ncbi:MAG: biopolymer transporter ExbD [Thermodesulfovibrionales bacterium]|nr:biopolymer transporter ExbD [Thermodesulfovibrionales bacterium]
MQFKRRKPYHTHLNIAPLVDVVFLLLLFFMLTSHLIQEPAIKVRLPESKTAEARSEMIKTVLITKNGEIYFMDKRVDLDNLQIAIKENLRDLEREFLRIKADRDVSIGLLVSVIDEVRLSGVKNFSIVAERR